MRHHFHHGIYEYCHTWQCSRTAKKIAKSALHSIDCIRKDPPILKEALVELILGQSPIWIWVYIEEIMDKFILGLDVLHAYDVFLGLGRHMLHVSRSGRGIPMNIPDTTLLIWSYGGQWPGDTSTMQESADNTAREPPGSSKWPSRT
jgi:hypothetical protein